MVERVREAISASSEIPSGSVNVYLKGSYKANTNVRRDSDVDICVEWRWSFKVMTWDETAGMGPDELGYVLAPPEHVIEPGDLRGRVERALINHLGGAAVDISGDKAIDVAADSTTLEADVIPCFWLRRYDKVGVYNDGQRIFPKSGSQIDNYPQQNYDNGVTKNTATGQRYKKIVRCYKKCETEMFEEGRIPRDYPGFLIECLLYNVPDAAFGARTLFADVVEALKWLLEATSTKEKGRRLEEVNGLLWLFRGPNRSAANANAFLGAVLDRLVEE